MATKITSALVAVLAAGAVGAPTCAKTIEVGPGPAAQERLQTALIDAKPGDVVRIAAGRYDLVDGLSLDVSDVTVEGAGPERTVLAFDRQKGEGEGLLITSSRVLVKNIGIENPKGDGFKSNGADQISFVNLKVEWTGGPRETNGPYGLYPVNSTNVLIDRVVARGASDTGIYVGQSRNVVVENSRAEFNVAGIEIENCYNADVHDNISTRNAGGILVFDLPGLPQMGGHSTRVYRNQVVNNDTPNFAPKGNIVSKVPTGTGVLVMANRDIHVFDNAIDGNASAGVMLISYAESFDDPHYNPLPREISVHGNHLGRNGFAPTFPGGADLAKVLGGTLAPVFWDGVTAFTPPGAAAARSETVRLSIADGPVVDLNLVTQGASPLGARPTVTRALGEATLVEPAPVRLPEAQLRRAGPQ
ncbi:MAG TPA: parallel beta-helix domain-containing protein [Caulobacteraceae bacterium]